MVLPNEVQGYRWHKKQVSVFMCAATTQKGIRNFAVISDHIPHHSAYACFAIAKVRDWPNDIVFNHK